MDTAGTKHDILIGGVRDYTGLWEVAHFAKQDSSTASPDAVRRFALTVVAELVMDGCVEPGTLTGGGGFDVWEGTPSEWLDRITAEWPPGGATPNVGDVCWFSNTERGNALGKRLIADSEHDKGPE